MRLSKTSFLTCKLRFDYYYFVLQAIDIIFAANMDKVFLNFLSRVMENLSCQIQLNKWISCIRSIDQMYQFWGVSKNY